MKRLPLGFLWQLFPTASIMRLIFIGRVLVSVPAYSEVELVIRAIRYDDLTTEYL